MRRRTFLGGGALAAATGAHAAATGPPRVAILSQGSNEARPVFTAFRAELRERGYIEGGTIAIEFHLAHGSTERLAPLAQAIARDRPEVVLADGGEAASAMRTATREIPIVAIGGIDPRQRVLVESLARPGGNVTGFTRRIQRVSATPSNLTR